MIELAGSPWIPVVFLVGLALTARMLQGSWLAPSAFVGILWSAYLALPLWAMSDRISPSTLWAIVGLVSATQIGAFLMEEPDARRKNRASEDEIGRSALGEKILRISIVCALLALLGSVYFAVSSIRDFGLAFSVRGFLSLGSLFYGLADEGEFESLPVRALMMWVFSAALLGGMATALVRSPWKKLLGISFVLPSVLYGATVAMRMGLLISTCCWTGGYLAVRSYRNETMHLLGRKLLLSVALATLAIVTFYVALDIVRGAEYSAIGDLTPRLKGSYFGYLAAFDTWWNAGESHSISLGGYTLAGAFDLMGLKTRKRGLYTELVTLDNGVTTNIFTAFRGVIEDFSFSGAIVVSMLLGMLAGRAYSGLSSGRPRGFLILAGYYTFFIWSPIVSVFNYNGVLVAWAFGAVILSRSTKPLFAKRHVDRSRIHFPETSSDTNSVC